MKNVVGKVVVLGYQGVGKTSTITRYVEKTFTRNVGPTIGASFFSCNIEIDRILVTLQIWDTAGQERFKAMAPMFYRNANAALLLFDITSRRSFESMQDWVLEVQRNVEECLVMVVVGNKIDLADEREVSRDEAIQFATSIDATYLECSALANRGVGIVFEKVAQALLRISVLGDKKASSTIRVYDEDIMARSSELEATDTAQEEIVNLSISSIAHGKEVDSKCCF